MSSGPTSDPLPAEELEDRRSDFDQGMQTPIGPPPTGVTQRSPGQHGSRPGPQKEAMPPHGGWGMHWCVFGSQSSLAPSIWSAT